MKTYYKVVDDRLQSIMMNSDPRLCTQYIVGEYVSSPIPESPLLVFKTLNDAQDFAGGLYGCIYTCHIKHKVPKPWVFDFEDRSATISTIVRLIKAKKRFLHLLDLTCFPEGTVGAKQVKLLNRVK